MKKVTLLGSGILLRGLTVFFALTLLPFSAIGADRLMVKDSLGNTKFLVTDTGNVGIGTTSPSFPLTVQGGSGISPAVGINVTDNTQEGYFGMQQNGTLIGTFEAFGSNFGTSWLRNALAFTAQVADLGTIQLITKSSTPSLTWYTRMFVANNGNIGIGTSAPTQVLDINSNGIRIELPKTPASSSAACNQGDMSWDASYVYVCVAANSWKRAALSSW